ncbi:sugar transporter ERD6-like 7 isoform X2 [Nymphaea colorata]|uniref:sugar transporter ERD6-like 7 isoform X2 n=1 Tax=Nymphaea colorata TaxID=210225 RepID=UPI00129EFDBD|nr:sugar transporter ERD6-like 7 isoform X2 [Nymphaea colorata]
MHHVLLNPHHRLQKSPRKVQRPGEKEMDTDGSVSLIPKQRPSMWMAVSATLIAACGSFENGACSGYSSPTESAIISDLELTTSQYSVFGSLLTVGGMIGAIGSGPLADYVGRKWAMRISSALCVAGWIFIMLSQHAWSLDVGRFCTGVGIGICSYVVPVYMAEIAPKELRGRLMVSSQLMLALGMTMAYLLGIVVGWRVLTLLGIFPCFVQLIGLFFVPESPRWLAKIGHIKEFEIALQRFRGKDADIHDEAMEILDTIASSAILPQARIRDLFQRQYTRPLLVGIGLMALANLNGASAIQYYASDIFVSAGFSSGDLGTILLAAMQVPLAILVGLLLDRIGRKPLMLFGAAGTCLGCFMAGASFLLKEHEGASTLVLAMNLTGIMIYGAFYVLGMSGLPWVIISEIFDLKIKAIAGGFASMVTWLASWLVSYTYSYLESWSAAGTFFIYSGVCAVTFLFVIKLVPETKGRTLEEIHESMSSHGKHGSNATVL